MKTTRALFALVALFVVSACSSGNITGPDTMGQDGVIGSGTGMHGSGNGMHGSGNGMHGSGNGMHGSGN